MSSRFARKMKPMWFGRKKLYKGYRCARPSRRPAAQRTACRLASKPVRCLRADGAKCPPGRWYDYQSWLGRTTTSLKSGVVRKTAAYDAAWRTPPLPAPLRPTFREPGSKRSRIPCAAIFSLPRSSSRCAHRRET